MTLDEPGYDLGSVCDLYVIYDPVRSVIDLGSVCDMWVLMFVTLLDQWSSGECLDYRYLLNMS